MQTSDEETIHMRREVTTVPILNEQEPRMQTHRSPVPDTARIITFGPCHPNSIGERMAEAKPELGGQRAIVPLDSISATKISAPHRMGVVTAPPEGESLHPCPLHKLHGLFARESTLDRHRCSGRIATGNCTHCGCGAGAPVGSAVQNSTRCCPS